MAWAAPQLEAVIKKEKYGRLLGIRSAWCIRTAARAVPTHAELAALSEHALSKTKEIELLKFQADSAAADLETFDLTHHVIRCGYLNRVVIKSPGLEAMD